MSWKDTEKINPNNPESRETACVHPWEWYSIDLGFGMFRCCPRQSYRPIETGAVQFNNHEHLQDVRHALVKGIQHPSCNDCWQSEAAGNKE